MSAQQRRSTRPLLAFAALSISIATGLGLLALRDFGGKSQSATPVGLAQGDAEVQTSVLPPLGEAAPIVTNVVSAAESSAATNRIASAGPLVSVQPGDSPVAHTLFLSLRLPDGTVPQGFQGTLQLTNDAGEVRVAELGDMSFVELTGMSASLWRSTLKSEGYVDHGQEFDMSSYGEASPSGNVESVRLAATYFVWPSDWVRVRAASRSGGSLEDLARTLNGAPVEHAFADKLAAAFGVRFALDQPPTPAADIKSDPTLAVFKPKSPGETAGRKDTWIGSVVRSRSGPMWLGLTFEGAVAMWQVLGEHQSELLFEVDAFDLSRNVGSVLVRLVQRDSGTPLESAQVGLMPVEAGLLPGASLMPPAGTGGEYSFASVKAGWHELKVVAPAVEFALPVLVRAGACTDLGTIAIGPRQATIEFTVVDETGRPVDAMVKVLPYQTGEDIRDLQPPSSRLWIPAPSATADAGQRMGTSLFVSGDQRVHRMPMPLVKCVVLVTASAGNDIRASELSSTKDPMEIVRIRIHLFQAGGGRGEFLLDPDHPPPSPWVLQVRMPRAVTIHNPAQYVGRICVLDASDMIVFSARASAQTGSSVCSLLPGAYRCRLVGDDGATVRESTFQVAGEGLEIDL